MTDGQHAGLNSQRTQAACKAMGSHDAQLLADFAAVVCAYKDGVLDSDDLDAVTVGTGRRDALSMLASLPSVRGAYLGARLRLDLDAIADAEQGRYCTGM